MAGVMVLSGEYGVGCRDKLRRDLDRLASEAEVVLDVTRVTFFDSTCLSELLRLHQLREANELQPLTVLLKRDGPIYRLFDLVNLTSAWRTVDPAAEAVWAPTT